MESVFSQARDGLGFVQWIESSPENFDKWINNLLIAEHQGFLYFQQLAGWQGLLSWAQTTVMKMSIQEFHHYSYVKEEFGLYVQMPYLDETTTLADIYEDERRAVMRFYHILKYSQNVEAIKLARRIYPDECFHAQFLSTLSTELDFASIKTKDLL